MKIFAIGDLHLSFANPKPMGIFGENWVDHHKKIRNNWMETVSNDDLVLVPGDISWAMTIEEAAPDLQWLEQLPGMKIIIRGNHDYWWQSLSKVRTALGPTTRAIQNDSITIGETAICGTRLWQDPNICFDKNIEWVSRESIGLGPEKESETDDEKIFKREINRLKLSLESIKGRVDRIITMLHYPPTDFAFKETRTAQVLMKYGVNVCVFGHLHSLKRESTPDFPVKRMGVEFFLASCDYVDFKPVRVF